MNCSYLSLSRNYGEFLIPVVSFLALVRVGFIHLQVGFVVSLCVPIQGLFTEFAIIPVSAGLNPNFL